MLSSYFAGYESLYELYSPDIVVLSETNLKTKLTLVSSVWALIYIYFDRVYLIICMARKLFVREWLPVTCDLILICNKKNIRSYYFLGNERFFLFYAVYLALTSQMLSKRKLMASAKWRSNIEYRKRIIHLSFS